MSAAFGRDAQLLTDSRETTVFSKGNRWMKARWSERGRLAASRGAAWSW